MYNTIKLEDMIQVHNDIKNCSLESNKTVFLCPLSKTFKILYQDYDSCKFNEEIKKAASEFLEEKKIKDYQVLEDTLCLFIPSTGRDVIKEDLKLRKQFISWLIKKLKNEKRT